MGVKNETAAFYRCPICPIAHSSGRCLQRVARQTLSRRPRSANSARGVYRLTSMPRSEPGLGHENLGGQLRYPNRFKSRVRELTRRTGGQSLSQVAKELSVYLVGWRA